MRRERKSVVITNQESELEKLNGAMGDNTKPKDEIIKEIRFIPTRTKDKAWTLLYGIFNGARFAAFYAAVLFMPMADYIVCIATTPIFSYVFSCLLIKTKFTILKVCRLQIIWYVFYKLEHMSYFMSKIYEYLITYIVRPMFCCDNWHFISNATTVSLRIR